MIHYSISLRSCTVQNPAGYKEKRDMWFATAQSQGTMSLGSFAEYLTVSNSHYQASQVTALVGIIAEQLKFQARQSRRVALGELGTFGPALSSEGVMNAEDFSPSRDIKKVYLAWDRSSRFSALRDARFTIVATRAIADAGRKAVKKASNIVNVNPENEDAVC